MLRLILVLALCVASGAALAAKRVALVIGNDAYTEVVPLRKAVADAAAVAERMEAAGYRTILVTDADRRGTNLAISELTSVLEPGDTAFVFFAGHGVQIEGENYLLPTDIAAPDGVSEGFVRSESIALSDLLARIRGTGARTTLAIIDACRDNPFPTRAGRSIGGTRGLARIAAPEGTFVMFSAGAGQQALDRLSDSDPDANSVFTRALLPKLEQDGLELRDMIFDLREEVRALAKSRGHSQFPAYYDELLGDFYLRPASATAPAPLADGESGGDVRADFDLARQVGTAAALERFVESYASHPDQFAVDVARDLLSSLEGDTAVDAPEAAPEVLPSEVPDAAREVMRRTQEELNRVGCNAGGADGIAGRRTRSAFAAYLSAGGVALTAADLGSERALEALRAEAGRVCETARRSAAVPQETAPAGPTIAGTWAFRAQCPLFIQTTGTSRVRQTGPNAFAGEWSDSAGQVGTSRITMRGLTFSMAVTAPGVTATETGTLSADGRSYRSSNSFGCQVSATRVN